MKKLFTLAAVVLASLSLWANQTDLIDGVTLPDVPATALDMATQTFKTADDNGWIVMEPNADIRNAGVTWFTALAWNTTSVTVSDVSSFTAPFTTLNSVSCTTVQKTGRTKAIRFTNATDISFLVLSGGSRTIYVSLFSYSGGVQTLVETKSTNQNSATELLFSDLATTTDYIAYMYESKDSNGVVAEIAIKKFVNSTDPVAEVTIDGPTLGTKDIKSTFTATTDVKADAIKWFVNDAEQAGATDKTFEFTPNAIGSYNVVCKARNANNATDEWIASSAITLKVFSAPCGEIIKATLTSGSAATVTGTVGGTADVSLSSNKKMDNGKYFGITLASGSFQEGDTVVITMTTAGSNYPCLFADKERTNCLFLATEGSSDLEYKIVLPEAANGLTSLYLSRNDDENYKWNPILSSMAVVRSIPTKSTVETLTGVTINDEAISAANLAKLQTTGEIILEDKKYVDAPIVKFTKHTVITYEDDSQKEIDEVIEKTSTVASAGVWGASATIGGNAYTVYTLIQSSVVVTYMDGETKLGEENVEIGGHPANYANFQNKDLASFVAWFNNADLAEEHKVADISAEVINVATTFYGKWENAYATSVNFEKIVMQNGKGYDIIPQLGTQHYASNITGSLDSLDNSKSDKLRNYAYLGLKVKQSGALLNFRLAKDNTVKIKFGNVAKTPQASINGGGYADITITDKVYTYTAEEDALISIKMMDGNAVVFQQIMIGEDLQAPELFSITCATVDNGTFATPYKLGIPDEKVVITATPADGYKTALVLVNGTRLALGEEISFDMPAENVTITGEFTVSGYPTALDNTEDNAKAVKMIENGQIVIIKNGVRYNVLGAELR